MPASMDRLLALLLVCFATSGTFLVGSAPLSADVGSGAPVAKPLLLELLLRHRWGQISAEEASGEAEREQEEVQACQTAVRLRREALALCTRSQAGRLGTRSLQFQQDPPECNCFCPTCIPDNWPDLAELPPCTTPEPPSGGAVSVTAPMMPPSLPLPDLPELPKHPWTEDVLLQANSSGDTLSRPLEAASPPSRSRPGTRLERCRKEKQESLLLLQSRGCAATLAGPSPPAPLQQSSGSRSSSARPDDGVEALAVVARQLHLRQRGLPAECNCHCPPCNAGWPQRPTCRPPGMVITTTDPLAAEEPATTVAPYIPPTSPPFRVPEISAAAVSFVAGAVAAP